MSRSRFLLHAHVDECCISMMEIQRRNRLTFQKAAMYSACACGQVLCQYGGDVIRDSSGIEQTKLQKTNKAKAAKGK